MSDHNCWKFEYDWEVWRRLQESRETVLCVLFDNGAQRQFSSVRITLLCSNHVTPKHLEAWRITPQSSSLSVVSRVSSMARDTRVTQNAASLPICNIVFVADRHSARRHEIKYRETKLCGELVFSEASSPESASNTIFEFDQPLMENTQSVCVSFTSSYLLYALMSRGVFFHPLTDVSTTVGRVVRVLPVAPMSKRRTISLPIDVLLLIFESLRFPLRHRSWRKDILSSALVCREWTCALDVLLVDFHSRANQQGYPPEIVNFADGLVAHPNLGLGIKYLSAHYLENHPIWNPYPDPPTEPPSPKARSRFGKAFLSILRVSKNVQVLRLDSGIGSLVVPQNDPADALRGLSKLETFKGMDSLCITMAQLVSCIATWPSLKRLFIRRILPPSNNIFPLASPSCCLTELEITGVPIKDDELTSIVSASGSTLGRLMLVRISELTNAGLAAALNVVCASLTFLWISCDALSRDENEEHALDATITRMARLTRLRIHPHSVASERMVERRAEAFLQRNIPALPEVDLVLIARHRSQIRGLMKQVDSDWPGWKISTNDLIYIRAHEPVVT